MGFNFGLDIYGSSNNKNMKGVFHWKKHFDGKILQSDKFINKSFIEEQLVLWIPTYIISISLIEYPNVLNKINN